MASVTLPILFLKHTNKLGKGFSSSQRNVIAGLNFSIGVVDKIAEIFTAHLKRTKAGSTTRIYPMSSQVHPQIESFHSPISASCTPCTFRGEKMESNQHQYPESARPQKPAPRTEASAAKFLTDPAKTSPRILFLFLTVHSKQMYNFGPESRDDF